MDLGNKYSKLSPAAGWPGGAVFTAEDPDGNKFFIREASKAEAGAAPFLSHPDLPVYVETLPVSGAEGKKYLVYEHFEGESVAAKIAAGGTFTEIEALKIGYETARALQYLHGLSPRVAHGSVSAASVFRTGGQVFLCGCAAAPDTRADLLGLSGLMRAMAAAHRGGNFSDSYNKVVEYLERPNIYASSVLNIIESVGSKPILLPEAAAGRPGKKMPRYAWAVAAMVMAAAFYSTFVFRFYKLPELRARFNISQATKLAQDYPCSLVPVTPSPGLGVNLVFNPSLEGPCGWHAYGGFKRSMIKRGSSHGGVYYFAVKGPQDGIYQDVNVSRFAGNIAGGGCRIKLSGYLRAGGSGRDGEPYLYGYAMRAEDDYAYLSGFPPVSSKNWTEASHDWPLPAGTNKIRVFLMSSSYRGTVFSKSAYFDDISAEVYCP